MGFSPDITGGYGIAGGEGRGHLPGSPTAPRRSTSPLLPPAHSALAVRSVPLPRLSPSLRLGNADAFVQQLTAKLAPVALHFGLERAALSSQSAPSAPAPPRLTAFLRSVPAPFKGTSKDLNPTSTATTAPALPVGRLLVAGALVAAGLSGGGAWRWVALAGAGLAASSLYTFVKAPK